MKVRIFGRTLVVGGLLSLTLIPVATSLNAQAPTVGVGSRVRIYAPSLRRDLFVGRIDSLTASDMVLDTAKTTRRLGFSAGPVLVEQFRRVHVRTNAVERIELSLGRTTRSAMIKGAVVGGLGGAVLFGLGNMPEVNPDFQDFMKNTPLGFVVGGVAGALIGRMLGGEKWGPARLP